MPTPVEITNRILRGQLLQASLAKGYAEQEKYGQFFNFWDKSVYVSELVEGLLAQYTMALYYDDTTLLIYNKLGGILGLQFIDGATLDPDAQHNGEIIIIGSPESFNSGRIFFNGTDILIDDYQDDYYSLYGNNPILAVWTGSSGNPYTEDTATVPTLTYVNGNISEGIDSISISYPVTTEGYIQITGIEP